MTKVKYLIEGKSISIGLAIVVAKLSITGKLVIITIYKREHYQFVKAKNINSIRAG